MNLIDRLDSRAAAIPAKETSKHETAAVCRNRAAADLVTAAAMINANQRLRMESSSASWTARALFLERIEENARNGLTPSGALIARASEARLPRL